MNKTPTVNELHAAENGDGLLLSGYAATYHRDRVGDTFTRKALEDAAAEYMATNPILLYFHKLSLPPIGRVLKAVVDDVGLWIEAVMPKPPLSSAFAREVWQSARDGLLRAYSVGGVWHRDAKQRIVAADLREISLVPLAVNGQAFASEVKPTEVKAVQGGYVRKSDYAEYKALTEEIGRLESVQDAQIELGLAAHSVALDIFALRKSL